jgi:NAD(P)-dependent dehydrogenase (short-subunit alcohol dehydrogenase family)
MITGGEYMKIEDTSIKNMLDISGRVAIITGGAGLLGIQHAEAIIEGGGTPILIDINKKKLENATTHLKCDVKQGVVADITKKDEVERMVQSVVDQYGKIDILVNNAANNPKMESDKGHQWSKLENFPIDVWNADLAVSLTGAFLCCQVVGRVMVKQHKGVVVNVASDLGIIAPDQRVYRLPNMTEENQPYKPATYCVVKGGLISFTRYLATYWAKDNIRVNTLTPASVSNGQNPEFVKNLSNLIPMNRMSKQHEFKAALLFLVSDASSYMTGANLVIDGGRTAW